MDVSPYLRKPLRSLQEVVETLKPADPADSPAPPTIVAPEPDSVLGDPLDTTKI